MIGLLSDRQKASILVAQYKKENDIPIHQPKREKEVLEKLKLMAAEKGISDKFIVELYRKIFLESKRIQRKAIR